MDGHGLVRSWLGVVACGAIIVAASAQEKPAAADPEAALRAAAAKELGDYAALCTKNGFPSRARDLWFEVLGEYDPDAGPARQALGFRRHGDIWQRDPAFLYPEHDQPDVAVARMLTQRWLAVAGRLATLHSTRAEACAAAGEAAGAAHHAARAARFRADPGDAPAPAADALSTAILQRSQRFEKSLAQLLAAPVAAAAVQLPPPLSAPAGRELRAVQSKNFTIFGDQPLEVLLQAAGWAERALSFCAEATAGAPGYPSDRPQSRVFVFFTERAHWAMFVRKHASNVEFIVENATATELGDIETAFADQAEMVYDIVVRRVAEDWCGFRSPALVEGIGHAVVGLFFHRNLVFTIGEPDPRLTVASQRGERFEQPDLETWRQLNLELAWQKADTPAAVLPRLSAVALTSPARIKAWSFCDFLLRADPALLRHLDAGSGASSDDDAAAVFAAAAGRPLLEFEQRWRALWTQDGPLRAAVLGRHSPLAAASKDAAPWLAQWNRLRQRVGSGPVGWSSPLSLACKQHVDYLLANKDQRTGGAENTQLLERPQATAAGRTFAQRALVTIGRPDPKLLEAQWLSLPGFRDALLDPGLSTIGVYAEGGIAVFDAERGRSPAATGRSWPFADDGERAAQPVPASAPREWFGPVVAAALAPLWPAGAPPARIGCPLSLHLFGADRVGVTCRVLAAGSALPGVLLALRSGPRSLAAPGLWVFYPAQALPVGKELRVEWTWPGGGTTVRFTAS